MTQCCMHQICQLLHLAFLTLFDLISVRSLQSLRSLISPRAMTSWGIFTINSKEKAPAILRDKETAMFIKVWEQPQTELHAKRKK